MGVDNMGGDMATTHAKSSFFIGFKLQATLNINKKICNFVTILSKKSMLSLMIERAILKWEDSSPA